METKYYKMDKLLIFRINEEFNENFFEKNNIFLKNDIEILIIDIDKNSIYLFPINKNDNSSCINKINNKSLNLFSRIILGKYLLARSHASRSST